MIRENIIVYASDTNYVPHMAASMLSVMSTNKDLGIHFFVLDNNIAENEKNKLINLCSKYDRKIDFINMDEYLKKAKLKTSFNLTAFARLFIASAISEDKALYLDCDTVVNGSLKPLFELDLKDDLIAAVQDTVSSKLRMAVGLDYGEVYTNSGVLLINLKRWREIDIEDKFAACVKKFNGNVPHNDQGIINATCNAKTYILDAKYNLNDCMLFYTADRLKELFDIPSYYQNEHLEYAKKHPIIIHYTEASYGRPWFSDSNHPYKNVYLRYRKELAEFWVMPIEKTIPRKRLIRIMKQIIYKLVPFPVYKKLVLYFRKKKENS